MESRRSFLKKLTVLGSLTSLFGFNAQKVFSKENKSSNTGKEYQFIRKIPVDGKYDLVIAGGGPAGTAAAVSAGRLGAKVLLLEATGCLGGMGTSGLVCAFDPMSNGERMLVGGFMRELVDTMYKRGFLGPDEKPEIYRKRYHHWTKFQPEGLKLLSDEFVKDAGVEVRFFTRVVDADVDSNTKEVNGVIINNIEGFKYIKAKTFIDSTGDAVLSDLCGVECREAGRDTPHIMPATLPSLFAGIDWNNFKNAGEMYKKTLKEGHFSQYDRHYVGMSKINQTVGYLNGGHIFNLDALRTRSLSDGMIKGRKIAQEFTSFYRKYVPGCENIQHVTTASLMGVRESRRIVGEYELTINDYQARRKFHDQIGLFNKAIDIHPYDTSKKEYERFRKEYDEAGRLRQGESFGIPYSILVPKGWKNLWVAGRPNSSDVKVHGSIRVQPAASMMGQATGTAAVQSIETGQPANDLNTKKLVKTLKEWGAYLPQEELREEMTRD